jgi:hypothetical protein
MQKETQARHNAAPEAGKDGAGERRCAECDVKLSNYNPGPNCWQHTIGYPWRGPTAKPKF